jgi:glutathione synthase/RimK-type ligase-like ATP-grasp enzyme
VSGGRTLSIATCREHADLTDEDRSLGRALADLGITIRPRVWSDPDLRPRDPVLIRSCWDYHLDPDGFAAWVTDLERDGVAVDSPASTVRWNMHKGYLLELERLGVAIPATSLLTRDGRRLGAALDPSVGPVVVKPAISMSGWETHLFPVEQADRARSSVERLIARGDVIVQAFHPSIHDGEISLVFVAGDFSHAIRKRPAAGEFRVQSEHGGSREPFEPPAWLVAEGARILALAPGGPLIARVDGVVEGSTFVLMELEVIDPMLFLDRAPGSAQRVATAIARRFEASWPVVAAIGDR